MAASVRPIAAGAPACLEEYLSVNVNGPTLVFDYARLGLFHTAIGFVVVNNSGGSVTVLPEVSPDGVNAATVGLGVPEVVTLANGETSFDPYGIDILLPWWRLWVTGTGPVDVYVYVLPRGIVH